MQISSLILIGAFALAAASAITPASASAVPYPERGVASKSPSTSWESAFVSGNGVMGAMFYGAPGSETLVANHCRLFLPLGSNETVADLGQYLPEVRRIIKEQGYDAAFKFMEDKARPQGFPGLQWTDPYHPGFELKISAPTSGTARDYWRTENFATGEVTSEWVDDAGRHVRRMFVSRPDNVIVLSITGPAKGKLNLELSMPQITHNLVESQQKIEGTDWITCHNVYRKGKGGYDSAVRITLTGGTVQVTGDSIRVKDADEVLIVSRIVPFKKLDDSSPAKLKASLAALPVSYDKIFQPHAKAHGAIFNRAKLDLGGGTDRTVTSDELLDRASQTGKPSPALLEKMYDAGRYMFICSAGELPPNLQGIWTGTWNPAWSGDFTLDTNVQAAIGSGLSANMVECMSGYYNLIESFVPDCRENAKKIYGCRGILSNSRASNNCLLLHWGNGWPGQFWTAGAGWLSNWFYDHYLYTGDKQFLAKRTVPLLKDVALFYEDFLFVDDSGKYRFSPSFSPECGMRDNATMDIAVAREVLTNLIAACEELKIEKDNLPKWKAMLAKMPPYLINKDGALQEWALPDAQSIDWGHRHHSLLYPVFESHELTPDKTPDLWKAAKVTVRGKVNANGEQSSFGRMQAGMSAAYLGMSEEAYGRLAVMAVKRSMYPSLITSHEPGAQIFNTDGNGSIPELINDILVFSMPGRLDILRALPDEWPKGSISGILARGQITIKRLEWDSATHTARLTVVSGKNQSLLLSMEKSEKIDVKPTAGSAKVSTGTAPFNRKVTLKKGEEATFAITWSGKREI